MQLAHRFQAFVVGADLPVGYFLTRLLAAQNYRYSSLSLQSREQIKAQNGGKPVMVLLPSLYEPSSFEQLEFWFDQAKEEDIPVLLLSSQVLAAESEHEHELVQLVAQAEAQASQLSRHLIIRTGALFSFMAADFANNWLVSLRAKESLQLDDTQLFNPTPADDMATVILAMLKQAACNESLSGLYHFNAVEPVTCYAFAKALAAEVAHFEELDDDLIQPQADVGLLKPWLPSADNTKLLYDFGVKPKPWRKGLVRLLAKHYQAD